MMKELRRRYEGVLDAWKVDLALQRIRAIGFARDQWPDLMQELSMVLLDFRYEPAKANGAKEGTALYAVVNRFLLFHLRTRCRLAANMMGYLREAGVKGDGTGEEPTYVMATPLEMDVAETVQGLDEFDRKICLALIHDCKRAQIARQLNCDWHTIDKAIRRIANRFVARGLRDWVWK